jgi:hypothetical protein
MGRIFLEKICGVQSIKFNDVQGCEVDAKFGVFR